MARGIVILLTSASLSGCAVQQLFDAPIEELEPEIEGPRPEIVPWSNRLQSDPVRNLSPVAFDENQAEGRSSLAVHNQSGKDPMRIHILNIAAGNCSFVECPNSDEVIVFDCGSKSPTANSMQDHEVVQYFYNHLGGDEPTVILSHPHSDHINLIDDLLSNRDADSFWLGGTYGEYRGDVGRILDDAVRENDPPVHTFDEVYSSYDRPEPEPVLQCGDASTYIAVVSVGNNTNEQSLVALLEYGEFSVVFPGDAHGSTEDTAVAYAGDALKGVDVVLASHHGAYTYRSNNVNWISHLNPSTVIYSSGESYGHPNRGVTRRYYRSELAPAPIHRMWSARNSNADYVEFDSSVAEYVTELTGVITIMVDGSTFSLECETGC